jgi:flagellar protein FliS
MFARQSKVYRTVSIDSAGPARLLDEMFLAVLSDVRTAREKIGAKDFGGKGKALSRALAIVGELAGSLEHERAPELCANLTNLYDFVAARLTEANVGMTAAPLDDAEKIIETLRDAFGKAKAR